MQVAFGVAKAAGSFVAAIELYFNVITADVHSGFNLATSKFFAPRNGTYVSHMCSCTNNNLVTASLYINNTRHSYLQKDSCVFEGVGRDFMMYHEANWQSYYNHQDSGGISDAQGLQTAWTMFRLDDLIQPLIGFSVTSNLGMTGSGVVQFNGILVNLGNGWNRSTNKFVAPINGTYFLSLCTFTAQYSTQRVQIQVNSQPLVEITVLDSIQYSDTFSNAFLKQLSQNDEVQAYLVSGAINNFNVDATNFIGFLYEPIHGMKVAWSVHRTTSATGPLEPVSFDYVMTNLGGGWNSNNHEFVSPMSGIYYLHLNVANQAQKMVNMQVTWNGLPYINIARLCTSTNGAKTNGRAIMTNITAGDKLHVRLANGTQIYSDNYKQTSFSGFLLYPNV